MTEVGKDAAWLQTAGDAGCPPAARLQSLAGRGAGADRVTDKANEIGAAGAVSLAVALEGRIVTADALLTHISRFPK